MKDNLDLTEVRESIKKVGNKTVNYVDATLSLWIRKQSNDLKRLELVVLVTKSSIMVLTYALSITFKNEQNMCVEKNERKTS